MKKEEIVRILFDKGFNCAQSVLTTFQDELDMDKNQLLRISAGFGGGMGQLQNTCGAVTGAFMVLSLKLGSIDPEDSAAKERLNNSIREFDKRFRELNQFTSCGELLGADLKTEGGRQQIEEEDLFNKICKKAIKDSVNILKQLI
jgi:C_GCAxxG_C_C family probable redox protein